MNLNLDIKLAEGYKSNSQIARVLTENWVKVNSYCPNCGQLPLNDFENNMLDLKYSRPGKSGKTLLRSNLPIHSGF